MIIEQKRSLEGQGKIPEVTLRSLSSLTPRLGERCKPRGGNRENYPTVQLTLDQGIVKLRSEVLEMD